MSVRATQRLPVVRHSLVLLKRCSKDIGLRGEEGRREKTILSSGKQL